MRPGQRGENRWIQAVILTAAIAAGGCGGGGEAPHAVGTPPSDATGAETAPSILLLTIDTLRADHLPFYGSGRETAPTLTHLAAGAVVYDGARSTSSWTVPSVVSWLTGVSPFSHGVIHGVTRHGQVFAQEVIPKALTCFPELLHRHGYRTMGITANAHLDPEHGFGRGFDRFACLGFAPAQRVDDVAREWLSGGELSERRTFLWLHYFDPHAPYVPHRPWFPRWAPDATKHEMEMLRRAHATWPKIPAEIRAHRDRYLSLVRALYDSEIAWCDSWIGKLLDDFPELDRFWIVFAADHGEELADHGNVGHGRTLFDETLRVPLFVRPPGGGNGSRIAEPVSAVDIPRTILAIAGIDAGAQWQGHVLPGLPLPGSGPRDEPVLAQLSRFPDVPNYAAIVDGRWKLIHTLQTDALALYDLEADPAEHHDLAAQQPGRARDLDRLLTSMVRALPDPPRDPVTLAISKRREEQLRSLGYLR